MADIYYGRGTKEHFDDYMDFINYVFGFNGNESDFKKLLPKLYKPELEPAYNSFNAIIDGKFKAAIGAFPGSVEVCGIELKTCGIGNVAVHPYSRGEGYMKKCLNMAIDDMIRSKVDLSSLGGQRQRYNYFSYENGGTSYNVTINKTNIRHAFGNSKCDIKAIKVGSGDIEYLDAINEMYQKDYFIPLRKRELLYDILCTWHTLPYVFIRNDELLGYCLLNGSSISEVYAVDPALIVDFVRVLIENNNSITLNLPPFKAEYVKPLEAICNNITISDGHMFTVLNFKKVIKAFMLLKATYTALPDGEINVLIHGRGGDEKLKISVNNGIIEVNESLCSDCIELDHLDAMRFFFSNVSMGRKNVSKIADSWFPLPIWEYSADAV